MVKNIENGLALIEKWLRNKNTIEFLGIWEEMYNPDFNSPEFEEIKNQAGLNRFVLSVKQWWRGAKRFRAMIDWVSGGVRRFLSPSSGIDVCCQSLIYLQSKPIN